MREIDSIDEFKHVIKFWKLDLCSCRLCKVYLQSIWHLQSANNNNNDNSNNNNNNNNNNNKNTYMSRKIRISGSFFPFVLRCTFTFPRLVICWDLWNLFEV